MKAIMLGVALAITAVSAGSAFAETTIIKKRGGGHHYGVTKKVVIKHYGPSHRTKKVVIKHKMD